MKGAKKTPKTLQNTCFSLVLNLLLPFYPIYFFQRGEKVKKNIILVICALAFLFNKHASAQVYGGGVGNDPSLIINRAQQLSQLISQRAFQLSAEQLRQIDQLIAQTTSVVHGIPSPSQYPGPNPYPNPYPGPNPNPYPNPYPGPNPYPNPGPGPGYGNINLSSLLIEATGAITYSDEAVNAIHKAIGVLHDFQLDRIKSMCDSLSSSSSERNCLTSSLQNLNPGILLDLFGATRLLRPVCTEASSSSSEYECLRRAIIKINAPQQINVLNTCARSTSYSDEKVLCIFRGLGI